MCAHHFPLTAKQEENDDFLGGVIFMAKNRKSTEKVVENRKKGKKICGKPEKEVCRKPEIKLRKAGKTKFTMENRKQTSYNPHLFFVLILYLTVLLRA